jgi:hypothetical protein
MTWRRTVASAAATLASILVLSGTAACHAPGTSTTTATPPAPAAGPSGSLKPSAPPPSPAALAGGACLLLDYATVAQQLGVTFDVAAAADSSGTYTCALQRSTAALPTLTLTITATDLTPLDFTTNVNPAGSKAVTGLGKIGYSIVVDPASSAGPAVEVGWLSGNDRLIVLRYVFPKASSSSAATAFVPKLVGLAKLVDQTTV